MSNIIKFPEKPPKDDLDKMLDTWWELEKEAHRQRLHDFFMWLGIWISIGVIALLITLRR